MVHGSNYGGCTRERPWAPVLTRDRAAGCPQPTVAPAGVHAKARGGPGVRSSGGRHHGHPPEVPRECLHGRSLAPTRGFTWIPTVVHE